MGGRGLGSRGKRKQPRRPGLGMYNFLSSLDLTMMVMESILT